MKKLFSIAAIVALLGSYVPTTFGATYSDELQGAYDYAYGIGITTQSSVDGANMYGNLIRAHMAKMMVNYAKEVLGKTADTSATCEFTDIANQSAELQGYIKEACQMGLMGVGITAFRPNDSVTRAEFGTVLSRALWGDKNNGGNPYYVDHLNALKDAGVMTNISNPTMKEVRGYVMLMMQRADESNVATEQPAICSTPENVLACSLGLDSCPTECKGTVEEPTETKAGTLNVSLNSDSLANGTQVPSTGTVKFAAVDFKASSSDVSLKTVEVAKVGLATIPSSTRIWFEKDGVRVSGKAAFSSEGKAVISFAPVLVVKAGKTETLDLYVELATSANQDFQFASNTITSTAEDVNGSFTTPTLRTAQYTVAPIDVAYASSTGSTNVTDNGIELGAFKVTNNDTSSETRDVTFKSVTLRQNGNGNIENLSDIVLERNGTVVAKNPTINAKDITFSIGDTVKDGTSATYYIKAIVNNVDYSAGDDYQFSIRNTSDVNAVEASTDFRSTVTFNGSSANSTITLYTNTVKGGDMTFTRDTSVALSANYAAGSENVILMKGTISAKSPVTLEDIKLNYTGDYASNDLSKLFSTIYLNIGSSTFSYSPTSGDTFATFVGSVTITSSATVKMYGKLKDTAPAKYVKFDDLKLGSFTKAEYVSNSNTVASAVGSIGGVQVTAQNGTLNVTRTDGLGNTTVAQGAKSVTLYGLKLSSDQGNGVLVSRVTLGVSGYSTGYLNNAYLTLYVDGKAVASKTIQGSTVVFDGFSSKVTTSTAVNLEVKADFADAFNTGTIAVALSDLNAVDALTSSAVTFNKPTGATFTVAAAQGTLAVSDNNPLAQLLLSPSVDNKVLAFKISAANDNVRLYDVTLTGTSLSNLSNFRLTDLSGNVIATATTATDTGVTFSQISNAPYVLKDKLASFFVVADANTNTNGGFALRVTAAGTTVKGTNGTTIPVLGSDVVANAHGIAQNTMIVAKQTNPGKLITSSALRFTVNAKGKDAITLTGLSFNNQIAGYTTAASQIVVYKNSVDALNIAGTGAVGTVTGPITLTKNNTVDAGNEVVYIVAIENTVVAPASNTVDWSVSLTDIQFAGLNAKNYSNIASFPLTEVK